MATYHWTGATDGDFETAGNWAEADGTVAAEYPGENQADDIVFGARATRAPSTNMDQSANANGIEDVTVADGYAYALGTETDPLVLKGAATPEWRIDATDAGEIWLVSASGTVASLYVADTDSGDDACHLAFVTNEATAAVVSAGNVTFDEAIAGNTSAGVQALTVRSQGSARPPEVAIEAPVTTLLSLYGGTVEWVKGTIADLDCYGGTFSARSATEGPTLTDATYYGGTLDLRTGGDDLTVSNAVVVLGDPVGIRFNIGQTLNFT